MPSRSRLCHWLLLLAPGAATSCLAPAPLEGARCDPSRVCGDGHVCQGGRCRQLTAPPIRACAVDADCPTGQHCGAQSGEAGLCFPCLTDAHCGGGRCTEQRYCVGCLEDGDCPTALCASNVCRGCVVDAECGPGRTCQAATCSGSGGAKDGRSGRASGKDAGGGGTP